MIHTVIPIRYDAEPNAGFQRDLKTRVKAYLAEQPAGPKANAYMWFKVAFFIVAYWGLWASLALFHHSLPVTLALIVLFSMSCVSLAYNVSHDAVHNALSKRRWVNEAFFQLTFNPLGPNGYLWRLRHKVMHHTCVNIPGYDFNIEASDILRFAPTQEWKPIHRFQHLYAPIAYMVFTIHWVFVKDVKMLGLTRIGNVSDIQHPWWRIAEVVAWKVVYVGYMLVLPVVVTWHVWWHVLLAFLFFQAIVSFQFVITFVGSHLNQGMVFVEPDETSVPHSFYEHQLRTSLDFHPTNPFVSFFFGGFNAHVAHHMFPHVCSVHYPAITKIIRRTAEEHGLPYQELDIVRLYVRHFRYLADMGVSPDGAREAYMHQPDALTRA
jgi:linoleoyl-CoA desaturase